jgi:hypothetical protein
MNASAGTNFIGWQTNDYTTLSSWQTATGYDLHSVSADPLYTNPAGMNYIPTAVIVNNLAIPVGILIDFNGTGRSPVIPDPGAFEFYNGLCNTVPGTNSFATPTIELCPGAILDLTLLNTSQYTSMGYTVMWNSSTTTSLGPFNAVSGATLNTYITSPINMTTYYNAVVTCTNGGASYTTPVQSVIIANTVTNTVPYYESFETLAENADLHSGKYQQQGSTYWK